jgi:hypothetical protein
MGRTLSQVERGSISRVPFVFASEHRKYSEAVGFENLLRTKVPVIVLVECVGQAKCLTPLS